MVIIIDETCGWLDSQEEKVSQGDEAYSCLDGISNTDVDFYCDCDCHVSRIMANH